MEIMDKMILLNTEYHRVTVKNKKNCIFFRPDDSGSESIPLFRKTVIFSGSLKYSGSLARYFNVNVMVKSKQF